jgi:ADP-ribosyl-[dinitrogen reductase] hydrolase
VDLTDRYRGALLGLACGDALGAPLEFSKPGTFAPVREMRGGGPFTLPPGYWTDDTSMALCLAESLVECGGFNPRDQLARYVDWWKNGRWSSTGVCFDIGATTRGALERFMQSGEDYCGLDDPRTAGNGALMRLAPVPLYFAANPGEAIELAGDASRTTHAARASVDACRYFAALLLGCLEGVGKDELLGAHYSPVPGYWRLNPLCPEIDEIASGGYRRRSPPAIRAGGYVVHCLEAALWAFCYSESFEEAVLKAVNLGEDADTAGAVCGQLAGAYHGAGAIPARWLDKLHRREEIAELAERLLRRRD